MGNIGRRLWVLASFVGLGVATSGCGVGKIDGSPSGTDAGVLDASLDASMDAHVAPVDGGDAAINPGPDADVDGSRPDSSVPLVNIVGLGPQATGSYETAPSNPSGGTDYFVDANAGDDAHAGTSPAQAFRTLAHAAGVAYAPGDRLFLARGSLFREQLMWTRSGTESAPIVIGAYGTGPAPIVSGGDVVTGFTVHSGNIYQASLPSVSSIDDLFVGSDRQTRARFPNASATEPYLFKDVYTTEHPNQAMGVRYLKDSDMPAPPGGSYVGASIVTRVAAHAHVPAGVVAQGSDNVLSIDFHTYNEYLTPSQEWPLYQWGYFFYDKLEFIDEAGEWYFDSGTHTLYLWAPGGVDPSTLNVEFASRDLGMYIVDSVHDVTVENIQFENTRVGGVRVEYRNERVKVEHNEIRNSMTGVYGWADRNAEVSYNFIHDIWESAIDFRGADGLTVSYNRVERVGLVPGRAANDWTYIAVNVQRIDGGTLTMNVHHNEVIDTGYIGLILAGPGLAEYNLFVRPMLMLNDGGGFGPEHVAWNEHVTYRYNILRDCVGNVESIAPDYHHTDPMCFGIYFGDHSAANALVEHNTVVNASGAGTLVDSAHILDEHGAMVPVMGQEVRNNVFYGCKAGILLTDQSLFWHNYVTQNCDPRSNSPCFESLIDKHVFGNTVYATTPEQLGMRLHYVFSDGAGHVVDYGASDNNYLFQPFTPSNTVVRHFDNGLTPTFHGAASAWHTMTLEEWQTHNGYDANSHAQSSATGLAPAATRGVLLCNEHFVSQELSVAAGTLERCLVDLDGNALGASITLAAMECRVAERLASCP